MSQLLYWISHLGVVIDAIRGATEYLADTIEIFAALIIGIAAVEALVRAAGIFIQRNAPPDAKEDVRLRLGRWLSVALEFELGADILRTAVAPSLGGTQALMAIAQLAAIAAIRTALNYFLQREIDAAAARQAVSPTASPRVQQEQRQAERQTPEPALQGPQADGSTQSPRQQPPGSPAEATNGSAA